MSAKELRKELRKLRETHCPPVGGMKKADLEKEVERLKGHKPTEVKVVKKARKPRAKKVKVEKKEIEIQTDFMKEEKPKLERREMEIQTEPEHREVQTVHIPEHDPFAKRDAETKAEKEKTKEEIVETITTEPPKRRKLRGERITEAVGKIEEKVEETREERNKRLEREEFGNLQKRECQNAITLIEGLKENTNPFTNFPNEREFYYKLIRKLQEFCEKNKGILTSPYNSIDDLPQVMRRGFSAWAKKNNFSFD